MIQSLKLKGIATYTGADGVTLTDLKKVNFFFGSNGSGKTTIGRMIDNPVVPTDCEVNWENGNVLPTFVYNQDYVRKNIYESDLAGIFTVGADTVKREEAIAAKRVEINQTSALWEEAKAALTSRKAALRERTENFKNQCWEQRKRFEAEHDLSEAFQGVRADKNRLFDRLVESHGEAFGNYDVADLRKKGKTVYGEEKERYDLLNPISLERIEKLEQTDLLTKPVVGKEDVEIGALIRQLNIDDWVSKGVDHLQHSGDSCPFCQQDVSAINLKAQLEAFFDDSYDRAKKALQNHQARLKQEISRLETQLDSIQTSGHPAIDNDVLIALIGSFKSQAENVLRAVAAKLDRPGKEISPDSLSPVLRDINALIAAANKKTAEHNAVIDNLSQQREQLAKQVWAYFRSIIAADLNTFLEANKADESFIAEKQGAFSNAESQLGKLRKEILALERQTTSTGPAIQAINAQLSRFGFVTFRLAESKARRGFYQIVRGDGSLASPTLSEGEKTFIAFLYFCEAVKGGTASISSTAPKVVVFDDPVSSLDSNILSIVSTLIREFISGTIAGTSSIKQVFILTHNVYFHKEVTYRYNSSNYAFWVVRRSGTLSSVEYHAKNPVMSSYELLWQELLSGNSIGRQNNMRRILEHYFKIMGGMNIKNVIENFPIEKRAACTSLFSWVNDGSHSVMDDLYLCPDAELMKLYEEVFKEIFVQLNHESHYDMMVARFAPSKIEAA
jgi:wobble nucleotide-excising tRNase